MQLKKSEVIIPHWVFGLKIFENIWIEKPVSLVEMGFFVLITENYAQRNTPFIKNKRS